MSEFRNLPEWDKAHELTVAIYDLSRNFPDDELLGLTQQIRLACSAVPIKIAQGSHREEIEEKLDFLEMARDSAIELEYYLLLCYELELVQPSDYDRLVSSIVEVKELLEHTIEKLSRNY
ncbi:four helix bundle protein [Calothrix sp. FACHB-1219]|uniref:four helix bundle protein n=1 Tax=unclassified Calothrix TaxID=2619626 RepID=UPI001681CA76|nr:MULTISPECIES: four helix bundle protein [unclassified Calothrix]MBD2207932.1 four helix bundle protein [Calothrix sp. FACHB-168]MBD2216182.1 four helix bundle protein [Calothrix sp. FACHB-1219]